MSNNPSPALGNSSPLPSLNRKLSTNEVLTSNNNVGSSVSNLDLSLPTALSYLIQHLIQPLSIHYSHLILLSLRDDLIERLTLVYSNTWEGSHPQLGSGFRSLICNKHLGLPKPLKQSSKKIGIDEDLWKNSISSKKQNGRGEEWQCWCDPGQVTWRWGGWEWEDIGYEPTKVIKEPFQIIWQSSSSLSPPISTAIPNAPTHTPARTSHAIPIKAPTPMGPPTPGPGPVAAAPALYAIPPTPSHRPNQVLNENEDLLPAFSNLGLGRPSGSLGGNRSNIPSGWTSSTGSRETSYGDVSFEHQSSDDDEHERDRSKAPSRSSSHRGSESTSSITSSVSDSNSGHTQLLAPSSRPNSADPFSIPPLSSLTIKDKENRSRKITPPTSNQMRGRTPSPNTQSNKDNSSITPQTDNTLTPSTTVNQQTPTVTPYDGGNVTVLGGGVKLGGLSNSANSSRPSSVMSHHGRSRSPSVSITSRALNTVTGPDGLPTTTSSRKQRTRRRIMPTYLGHLNQPGVGGPILGVFGQFQGTTNPSTSTPSKTGGTSVGVGVSPPPINVVGGRSVSLPTTMPRMG
ncbi:uncharacterized protein L201_006205 [Kwoniella dendrophila CBS 6074]|uniref:Anti-proliferative protein domain-containing protein n=1 Tax=Kwoniella dendrophila CBS 6074 TaxID=1295534 RepID=A0AAX4K126_9TREE